MPVILNYLMEGCCQKVNWRLYEMSQEAMRMIPLLQGVYEDLLYLIYGWF